MYNYILLLLHFLAWYAECVKDTLTKTHTGREKEREIKWSVVYLRSTTFCRCLDHHIGNIFDDSRFFY